MGNYTLENKNQFTVVGVGVELKSPYTDFAGIAKEKQTFDEESQANGLIDKLREIANNDFFFTVNEAYDNKMMYYLGVESDESIPEVTRVIQFPEGMYVIVSGEATSPEELRQTLTGMAFGQVLGQMNDYHYVGGPNAVVEMGQKNGKFTGEMWIPVIKKEKSE